MARPDSIESDDLDEGRPMRNPFEEALGQLVARIRAGDLPAGSRLPPERELSDELKVSRTTLRAVIRALQQAGLVRTQRGRSGGSFVLWQSDNDTAVQHRLSEQMKKRLLDTLRFRTVLEPGAAALAAQHQLTDEEARTLTERLAAATCSGPDFRLADVELHSYIAELTNCNALSEAIANVQLILNETLLQVVPFMGPALEHSHEQHAQIVEAIYAGNAEKAREVMQDHVGATEELIRTFLD